MKTTMKIRSLFLLALFILSCIFVGMPHVMANASSLDNESTLEASVECANFVKENFAEVIDNYNATVEDESNICRATTIEGECMVYLLDEEKFGIYLDFDGQNGYMLVTQDFTLYEFEVLGDLSYLKGQDFVFYTTYDKFLS